MRRMTLLCASAILTCALPAAAQTGGSAVPAAAPCQAQTGSATGTGQGQDKAASNDNLSGKLDRCNGVLKPPPTGDQEMTNPAPSAGKTPVIKPGEIKPQQPDTN